jgi:hypothetical protein
VATVNFSVPDDVKRAFDRTFGKGNKSAVIAELMRRAVAEAQRERRRLELFDALTERRRLRPDVSAGRARRTRTASRS